MESVGHNCNATALCTKIMPHLECYISIGCGVSDDCYRGKVALAGTGQGNKFLGDMCCNMSCLIMKQLELQNLGISFLSFITCVSILCSSVSFLVNTDLVVDRIDATCEMQLILD